MNKRAWIGLFYLNGSVLIIILYGCDVKANLTCLQRTKETEERNIQLKY